MNNFMIAINIFHKNGNIIEGRQSFSEDKATEDHLDIYSNYIEGTVDKYELHILLCDEKREAIYDDLKIVYSDKPEDIEIVESFLNKVIQYLNILRIDD